MQEIDLLHYRSEWTIGPCMNMMMTMTYIFVVGVHAVCDDWLVYTARPASVYTQTVCQLHRHVVRILTCNYQCSLCS